MILEAFAKYLRQQDPQLHATEVLSSWLAERLLAENQRENSVDSVIQCEITVERVDKLIAGEDSIDQNQLDKRKQDAQSIPNSTMSHNLPVPQNNLSQIAQLDSKESLSKSSNILQPQNQTQNMYVFKGRSKSGDRLLKSLVEYCLSIEHQKWARFVHSLKASDFKQID